MEKKAQALTADLKAARRARDSTSKILGREIGIVRRRQLILRRMLDAIVYLVCDQYVWFIRRLALADRVRPIDLDTLPHLVAAATRLSRRDLYTLYLVADLTTAVQIGDFVEASFDPRQGWHIRLVELKEGRANLAIARQLARSVSPEDIRESMGDKAVEQAERMLRQQRRLKDFSNIVLRGRGIDPRTGFEIQRTSDAPPTPGYQRELQSLIDSAANTGQHLITVDGCLTLAAIRAEILGEPHYESAVHSLFHFNHPGTQCLLPTARAQEELELLLHEAPVIDMVEHSLGVGWGFPIFSWGILDRVCDLLSGRIKVYAQFHADIFMERAARLDIKMKWVTGRRAEKLKQQGATTWIPGSPRASAILVELPDGTRFELLSGGLGRIFLEMARPDTILSKSLLGSGPEVRKMQEAHAERSRKK